MPFTPLHVGPGLLLKAGLGDRFSLRTFALVQVVIDVESVVNIARQRWPVHGPLHSFIGSMAVGVVVATVAYAAMKDRQWEVPWHAVTATGAALGGVLGGVTHTLIDGLMHNDLFPFWPWASGNPWLLDNGSLLATVGCAAALPLGTWLLGKQQDASAPR